MKRGKGREKKSRVVEAEDYDKEEGSSSDDEMPEVVSNAAMKSNYDLLNKEMEHHKQQQRHAEKTKRRQKQELFIAQKKTKLGYSQSKDIPTEDQSVQDPVVNSPQPSEQLKPTKKVYSSLNITVEPLTKIQNTRSSAALDFKSRRLAKVPRESIKTAVIAYQKKLNARKS